MEWLTYFYIYLLINFIFSKFLYSAQKKYYTPYQEKVKDEDGKTDIIDLHEKFNEFSRKDYPVSFTRIFLGSVFLLWIRLFIIIVFTCLLILSLKIIGRNADANTKATKDYRQKIEKCVKFFLRLFFLLTAIRIRDVKPQCKEVYNKYFGEDYTFEYDDGYSVMICNHTSWLETFINLVKFAPGFIAKKSVADFPLVGVVAKELDSLFVNRADAGNRGEIFHLIEERQKKFLNQSSYSPIVIYAEGTTTSGRHILKFKKGAFSGLLPIKPLIVKGNLDDSFHFSCGASEVFQNFLRSLCYVYHNVELIQLPIIKPNEFMLKNFSHFGKENWEIYAEVVREIYCEAGGFRKTDKTLRDSEEYFCIIQGIPVREKIE